MAEVFASHAVVRDQLLSLLAGRMKLVYVLLVAHFVGDFVCQTDWMATNKSKNVKALSLHVFVYSTVLTAFTVPFSSQPPDGLWPLMAFGATNGIAHFVQDAITSRINARLWQANERHWFFVGIGADQLLHYVALFVTASWWL